MAITRHTLASMMAYNTSAMQKTLIRTTIAFDHCACCTQFTRLPHNPSLILSYTLLMAVGSGCERLAGSESCLSLPLPQYSEYAATLLTTPLVRYRPNAQL